MIHNKGVKVPCFTKVSSVTNTNDDTFSQTTAKHQDQPKAEASQQDTVTAETMNSTTSTKTNKILIDTEAETSTLENLTSLHTGDTLSKNDAAPHKATAGPPITTQTERLRGGGGLSLIHISEPTRPC